MPKFIKIQLILSVIVLALAGIWWLTEPPSKEEVAFQFVEAYLNADMETCQNLASEATKGHYDILKDLIMFAEQEESLAPTHRLVASPIVQCDMIEDYISVCSVCCDEEGSDFKLNLKMEGRAWVVDMSKESIQNAFSGAPVEGGR